MHHPLLQLAAQHPQVLAEHASAWTALLAAEGGPLVLAWRRRWRWQAWAVLAGTMGLGLAAVAGMLWAVTPALSATAGAVLLLTPAPPLVLALGCAWAAGRCGDGGALARLAGQWHADQSWLHRQGAAAGEGRASGAARAAGAP